MSVVRPAVATDAADIVRLSGQLGYPTTVLDITRRLEVLTEPRHAVLVASDTPGRVVGWIHVAVVSTLESGELAEIVGLVVDTDRRGEGVGRSLVQASAAWAAGRGATTVRVRTRIERDDALAFYRRLGFELVKSQHVLERPA